MTSWLDANAPGYVPSPFGDLSRIESLMSPSYVPDQAQEEGQADVSRLYTLLLATVAGAGVALAAALLCCVLRTHMENRHRRQRDRPVLSAIQISQPHHLLGSRRDPTRPTLSTNPLSAQSSLLPPILPTGQLSSMVAALEAPHQPPDGPVAQGTAPREVNASHGRLPFTLHCMSSDGEPIAGPSKGRPPAEPDEKEQTAGLGAEPPDSLDSHLAKLLNHVGGEAKLAMETGLSPSSMYQGTLAPRAGPGGNLEEAFRHHRLQMASVAACGLRMASLVEVGMSPLLAALPPPWTPEFLELKLQLAGGHSHASAGQQLRRPSSDDQEEGASSGSEHSDSEMEPYQGVGEIAPAPKPCELYSPVSPSVAGSPRSPHGEIHVDKDATAEGPAPSQSARPPSPTASWGDVEEGSVERASTSRSAAPRGQSAAPPCAEAETVSQAELPSNFSELGGSREPSRLSPEAPATSLSGLGFIPNPKPGMLHALSVSLARPGTLRSWRQLKLLGGKSSVLALGGGRVSRNSRGRRGGQLSSLSPDDLDSTVLESRNLKLHGGSHIGIRQVHLLHGHKVEVYNFRVDIKRQMVRLCTLLESKPHLCVAGPLCSPISNKHRVLMPHSVVCDLEEALGGTEPEDSSPPQFRQCILPWRARVAIAYDLVLAAHHLHNSWEQPLLHGSIHAASINISHGFHGCLMNPGFLPASLTPLDRGVENATPDQLRGPHSLLPGLMPLVVDFAYLDPQYHKRGQFTQPADVYALGVVLLKLLTALPAKGIVTVAKEAYRQEMLEDILDPAAGEWPPSLANALAEFALSCCERRHTRRCKMTADAVFRIQVGFASQGPSWLHVATRPAEHSSGRPAADYHILWLTWFKHAEEHETAATGI
eukprot:CAMPEP_0117691404 /NCGR_PEP_ID=MMETSP0804-20121206/25703_1 /TAXON_ID=1074897 /ORGANISM="Tetraselmis astigmatica, Strain CCMP880" /LENGTH=877 /DNA_ID=CAMNT_0005504637 /DNA_START=599 /DNA_END=3232 /DNA_ORIENTATION=+